MVACVSCDVELELVVLAPQTEFITIVPELGIGVGSTKLLSATVTVAVPTETRESGEGTSGGGGGGGQCSKRQYSRRHRGYIFQGGHSIIGNGRSNF